MRIRTLLLSALFALVCVATLRAETVDEVINKHIDAIGGHDMWKKITSMKMEGTTTAQGMDIPLTFSRAQNKGFRLDITVMGTSGYQILTPTAGWVYMPFQGQKQPEAMTDDDVKQSADEIDVQDQLYDYKVKGSTAELIGKEDVEGTECYKIKLTLKNGKEMTEFIDPSNYYLIREVEKVKANGQEQDVVINYSNFKKLPEGITVPMTIGSPMGDVTMTKVTVNPTFDDSIFKSN